MTSSSPREVYVWIWLPGQTGPVVAGRLAPSPAGLQFNYGQSYLQRDDAIPLYWPELPLQSGLLPLRPGLSMPGCLRDGAPDAWGRRVILNRLFGDSAGGVDPGVVDELTYLLNSGSDRVGALDFQASAHEYHPRLGGEASLEQLQEAASRIEQGQSLPPALEEALLHGTSLGGARPKARIQADGRQYIAKFSSSTDVIPTVKIEFLAMRLAARLGLNVAQVERREVAGKDVLLVERFDRPGGKRVGERRMVVSALTILELDEMLARYASYEDLANIIRHRFHEPRATLRELFGRLVFNILCGNTDDHARNHAAFWDGNHLALTPAYDICPQARTGNEAAQAMLIQGQNRNSQLDLCRRAAGQYLLTPEQADDIIQQQRQGIHDHWAVTCDEAGLSAAERQMLWGRQFLNPYALGK
ncbi:HipA domain-containing protein [Gammaproteobacteria bacterium AB-CW1]|uniref:HipA domain-containing protein n=1 Tax=Natronospira elongata TaxID=3110268 RepID=A0AAP6JGQ1_9GAMM|nr:HipA domain-containing protein [Gammaproteobacteria bacterium AB-CW1]